MPFFPSNHHEEAYITTQMISTTALERGDVSPKLGERRKSNGPLPLEKEPVRKNINIELPLFLIEGEALEREDHPDHVFSHPLGLLSLSSHPTVD